MIAVRVCSLRNLVCFFAVLVRPVTSFLRRGFISRISTLSHRRFTLVVWISQAAASLRVNCYRLIVIGLSARSPQSIRKSEVGGRRSSYRRFRFAKSHGSQSDSQHLGYGALGYQLTVIGEKRTTISLSGSFCMGLELSQKSQRSRVYFQSLAPVPDDRSAVC